MKAARRSPRRPLRRLAATPLLAAALLPAAAHAGRPCDDRPPEPGAIAQGMALAAEVAGQLEASGADVVLLARAGQDLGRYGLRWSHLGFAYREPVGEPAPGGAPGTPPATPSTTVETVTAAAASASASASAPASAPAPRPAAVWRVAHKLNLCGTAQAGIFREGLGDFFLDRPARYEAAFVVLSPEAQQRLLPLLRDNARLLQWHSPAYSMVAYPWSTRYQQSNQWAIETLAGALEPGAVDRPRAQAWLQRQGYQPTDLHLGPLTRLGGRMTRANVAFDDHPSARRFSDHIDTVTVDSIFAWLPRAGLAGGEPVLVH